MLDETKVLRRRRHDVRRQNVDLLTSALVRRKILKLELVLNVCSGAQWSVIPLNRVDQVRVLIHDDVLVLEMLPTAVVDCDQAFLLV